MAETFEDWKIQARYMPFNEAVRHAGVSKNNRHACRECFCCACREAVQGYRAVNGPWRLGTMDDYYAMKAREH